MSYIILEHTADLKIKFKGATLAELFEEAGRAVMRIVNKSAGHKPTKVMREIEIMAQDSTALLIDWLNELLSLSHINKEVYTDIKIVKLDDNSLQAEIKGVRVERFNKDIKAATYHEAEVKKNEKGGWETIIVFDI